MSELPEAVGIGEVSPIPEEKSERGIGDAPHLTPDFSVQDWGFDTVGIAFEIVPDAEFSLQALRSANTKHNALPPLIQPAAICDLNGAITRVNETEKGNWRLNLPFATVKGFPDFRTIYVEGRASALLERSSSARHLVKPADLDNVEMAALRIAWSVLGGTVFLPASPSRYRRWDLAVDVSNNGCPQEGVRALEAFSAVRLPYWCLPGVNRVKRRVDLLSGVRWPASGNLQFRIYDKGLEMGLPKHRVKGADGNQIKNPAARDPGHLLRLERQMRPTNPTQRMTTSELQAADLRHIWLGRWEGCLSAPSLTVCSPQATRLRLSALFTSERKQAAQAKRLIAESIAAAEGLPQGIYGDDQKLNNELMKLGIVQSKSLPAWQSVELQRLLHQAADVWPTNKTRPRASSAGTTGPPS